ncbi:MAG: DUF805 domain-containing protein [Elusimicrobia bacterium]|nr:DUF805 domain-containing protein [Elusimicrobiota bacterium]
MKFKDYCQTYFTDIVFKHFFDFKGRAGRKVFWLFTLNTIIIDLVLSYFLNNLGVVGVILSVAFSILLFFPTLGLDVRRLHDINLSGWWVLIFIIPILGFVALLVFACTPGTEGENKYGPATVDVVADKVEETTTEEQKQ